MSNDHLFFFNANGVEVLPPSFIVDPELEIFQNTWALVDINTEIKKPAAMLCRDTSPFFLVMTSSPRTSQLRALRKYREPAVCWLMKPFNLSELIQASVFLASLSSFVTYAISQSSTSTGFSRGVGY